MGADSILPLAELVLRELALFAAVGIAIGGLDDLLVDLIWLAGRCGLPFGAAGPADLPLPSFGPPANPGPLAIFIPAWDEANVIGAMLRHCLAACDNHDCTLFVGCYANDPPTAVEIALAAAETKRIRIAFCPAHGPSTKADCLNAIWRRMEREEAASNRRFKAIVLHDAEDMVHRSEFALFDRLIEDYALVQIPVIPLVEPSSRWIGGHYCDEFAEAHGKDLPVRHAIGAGVPSAGVGCAIDREVLAEIAAERDGTPFDADSLTEDYELGVRLAARGERGAFVALRDSTDGSRIAVRAHFPHRVTPAVRQKTRWITGIALAGWDRLGWQGGPAEIWMRLRDRRAIIAALVIVAAYAALALGLVLIAVAALSDWDIMPPAPILKTLLTLNIYLLCWRLAMRGMFTARLYGWREGLRAVPRAFVSNVIAIMSARRALACYVSAPPGTRLAWDKTVHVFPDQAIA